MVLHIFNDQLLRLYDFETRYGNRLQDLLDLSLLLYVYASDTNVYIPTTDLIQGEYLARTLNKYPELVPGGVVGFVGASASIDQLLSVKRRHFGGTRLQQDWSAGEALRRLRLVQPALHARMLSTTSDMSSEWDRVFESARGRTDMAADLDIEALTQTLLVTLPKGSREAVADELHSIPDRLEGRAFLWWVIKDAGIVDLRRMSGAEHGLRQVERLIEFSLARHWLYSYAREYSGFIVARTPDGTRVDCLLGPEFPKRMLDLLDVRHYLAALGILELLIACDGESLVELWHDPGHTFFVRQVVHPYVRSLSQGTPPPVIPEYLEAKRHPWAAQPLDGIREVESKWLARSNEDRLVRSNRRVYGTTPARSTDMTPRSEPVQTACVFIGHGRSGDWRELKDFLEDRLDLEVEEFNRVPTAGVSIVERLRQMLDRADFAFLVMTAEDETTDGQRRARENVVHEVGLFQGRLGFGRAIVVLEEGCNEFSNIHGIGQLRYPRGRIMAVTEEIRRILEAERVVSRA